MVSGIRVAAVRTWWHALGNNITEFEGFRCAMDRVSVLPGCATASLRHRVLLSLPDETTILSRNVGNQLLCDALSRAGRTDTAR